MGFIDEFKAFALKGNVMDLAVGVIIGGAFGKIVSSLVDNVIMPFVGLFTGGVDFSSLSLQLASPAALAGLSKAEPATLNYGQFIQTSVDFIILAFVLFLLIKGFNTIKRKEEAKPAEAAALPAEQVLLTEIRDLLKSRVEAV